jgi:glycyl-tRNA synthetase
MKSTEHQEQMEKIVSLCKRRGFVFQGSEIYDGFAGVYDFGPLGVELLNNIKNFWWNEMVRKRDDVYGIDAGIMKDPKVWEASGHIKNFSDPMAECKNCKSRIRVDKELEKIGVKADEKMSEEEISALFEKSKGEIKCLKCGKKDFTNVKNFNLLVKSSLGDFSENQDNPSYLPGEACQGIYLNFKNVLDSMHPKIPFGIAQIGKAFRNEISPRNFLFRTRELEQADIQYFVRPGENKKYYQEWKKIRWQFYLDLGLSEKNLQWKQHENLAFYAEDAWDIEYNFVDHGFQEIEGLHDRTDYDLTQHTKYSGKDLSYFDDQTKERFIPYIIESSAGIGRMFLAVLSEAYSEDEVNGETRVFLKLNPNIAPYQYAVFPLLKNKPELVAKAREVYESLKKKGVRVFFDDNGNIGKRYRRQDEIGTPLCITIDFDTLEDQTVTVRDRDTGEQKRVNIQEL